MTAVEEVLRTRLTGFSGLASLVSARVYPLAMPQNVTYPAITYQRVSTVRISAMGGDTGDVRARFQFDVYGATYASVRAVADQARLALQRWNTTTGATICDIFLQNDLDMHDNDPSESTVRLFRVMMDFLVLYEE
jgi:hypothetical protein